VSISIQVIGSAGEDLEVYTAKGLAGTSKIAASPATVNADVEVSRALYIRAQLRNPQSGNVTAITNPIYLDQI
jgi:hypothetical protein